jgi:integrase/recombinase XerD
MVAEVNQATNLDVLSLWLHGKSSLSQKAYRRDGGLFLDYLEGKSLAEVTLADLQGYANLLGSRGYAPATLARKLAAMKSLLTFAQKLGVIETNVGSLIQIPRGKEKLAERILSPEQVRQMIELPEQERARVLLRFLYGTGARVSEVTALKWRDLQELAGGRAQVNLYGKRGKTRVVLLSPQMWQVLQPLRQGSGWDDPVFRSRKSRSSQRETQGHLDGSQVVRIVRKAAERAGIEAKVSPHWLRHSHASHSLERGASIQLVKESLGHSNLATTERYLHARPGDSSSLYLGVYLLPLTAYSHVTSLHHNQDIAQELLREIPTNVVAALAAPVD